MGRVTKINLSSDGVANIIAKSSNSIPGAQDKFYEDGVYYKFDTPGGVQGLVEVLVSVLLDHAKFGNTEVAHANYWLASVNGRVTCCSNSICAAGEMLVSFDVLLNGLPRFEKDQVAAELAVGNLPAILEFLSQVYSCPDLPEFYGLQMLVDLFFLDEDRHWGNSALLWTGGENYKCAPLFDNGAALLHASSKDITRSFLTFEPNPFGQEQLQFLPQLLGGKQLELRMGKASWGELFNVLAAYYPPALVRDYFLRIEAIANYVITSGFGGLINVVF